MARYGLASELLRPICRVYWTSTTPPTWVACFGILDAYGEQSIHMLELTRSHLYFLLPSTATQKAVEMELNKKLLKIDTSQIRSLYGF